jgi:hypothetical protein
MRATITRCWAKSPRKCVCPIETHDWGNIDQFTFDREQLGEMKKTCQKHCFSTLNHNLAYCYNDQRVIKWMWDKR